MKKIKKLQLKKIKLKFPKDKNAPKKPKRSNCTAYAIYCDKNRGKYKDLKSTEIMAKLGPDWRKFDKSTKKADKELMEEYKQEAKENVAKFNEEVKQYNKEVDKYNKTSDNKISKIKVKDENKPKAARSAYNFFAAEHRDKVKEENPEMDGKEITAEVAAQWKKIKETKAVTKYNKLAEEDKKRFNKETKAYEKKVKSDEDDSDDDSEVESDKQSECKGDSDDESENEDDKQSDKDDDDDADKDEKEGDDKDEKQKSEDESDDESKTNKKGSKKVKKGSKKN